MFFGVCLTKLVMFCGLGPRGTLYERGKWKVAVLIHKDYPFVNPGIWFYEFIYHPNVNGMQNNFQLVFTILFFKKIINTLKMHSCMAHPFFMQIKCIGRALICVSCFSSGFVHGKGFDLIYVLIQTEPPTTCSSWKIPPKMSFLNPFNLSLFECRCVILVYFFGFLDPLNIFSWSIYNFLTSTHRSSMRSWSYIFY